MGVPVKNSYGIKVHLFEKALELNIEYIQFELRGMGIIEWMDFILNPRRLRGSDFLMRWSQGVWSENRLTQAVNATEEFFAIPYGPSGTAPTEDVRAFELYFERLVRRTGKNKTPGFTDPQKIGAIRNQCAAGRHGRNKRITLYSGRHP